MRGGKQKGKDSREKGKMNWWLLIRSRGKAVFGDREWIGIW